jgi:Glycine-zipper domain
MMIASSLFERVNTDVPYAKFTVTFPLARVLALAPITLNWPGPIKRSVVMLKVCTGEFRSLKFQFLKLTVAFPRLCSSNHSPAVLLLVSGSYMISLITMSELGCTGWLTGAIGAGMGALVGAFMGAIVGAVTGALVGALTGALVGVLTGALVGTGMGALVGAFMGVLVGAVTGALVGALTGALVGAGMGALVGAFMGVLVGAVTGALVGALTGAFVGATMGALVGAGIGQTFAAPGVPLSLTVEPNQTVSDIHQFEPRLLSNPCDFNEIEAPLGSGKLLL